VAWIVGLEFGETNAVSRIVYGLVGISAVYLAIQLASARRVGEARASTYNHHRTKEVP
jgi:uncharacterized protein